MTTSTLPTHLDRPTAVPPARRAAGWGVVAAVLPYLSLKAAWIAGMPVGFDDPGMVHDPVLLWANVLTFVMDLLAAGLALALTYPWGRRLPGWLLLPPVWVATGFLAPIVTLLPVIAWTAVDAGSRAGDGLGLQSWVFTVVYAGFALQGLLLGAAFILHARDRWGGLLGAAAIRRPGAMAPVVVPLAGLTATLAYVAAAVHLVWVVTGQPGVVMAVEQRLANLSHAALAVAAAWGVVALVRATTSRRTWLPVALTWLGSAALFSWGLWSVLSVGFVAADWTVGASATASLGLLKVLAGVVGGVTALVVVAERAAPQRL